ncbi:hypothetical protein AMS68_000295 [Peltaster fructicola]|uniref:Uncharacterized protein n=1 Tax=Peltaster fructicola TaxID=286661 RepID=A0A6H0XJF9_9PEZI|nr:hypothetical protein AMS68_000295 [Peltaster fructicola]
MASPNVQYQQQSYFPPQMPENRRRSSSYTDRYRPASYSNPPSYQPDPALLGPHQYPLPPSPMPGQQPPYPVDNNMPNPGLPVQTVAQHQLGQEMGLRRPSVIMYPDGLTRQSYDGSHSRRPSHDSRYSHRSERSHHSHHSHHSRRHHHDDEEDEDEDEYDDDRRHRHRSRSRSYSHHHHHHHNKDELDELDAYRQRVKERGDNVSRSWGGSLLSVFAPLKYLLEPRARSIEY